MKSINNIINIFIKAIMGISAGTLLIIVFAQVLSRFVFKFSINWGTDVSRICFIYSVFFGATYAASTNGHLNLDVILNLLPEKVRKFVEGIINLLLTAFLGFVAYNGYFFMLSGANQKFPYLKLSMQVMYAPLALGCALMAFFYLQHAIIDFMSIGKIAENKEETGK